MLNDPIIGFLVHLIIYVAVIGVLIYILRLVMAKVEIEEPYRKIIWLVVFIVLLIAFVRLLGFVGGRCVDLFAAVEQLALNGV